jgi:C4-dicarboxylate transporter/malic acid transport protein
MEDKMAEPFKATPMSITEHFNPAWFAAIMGTAVIPLAISFLKFSWVPTLSFAFIIFSVVTFLIFLMPWTAKFFLYPASVRKDFNHPIASNFFPTMPIALILFSLNLMKYPTMFFNEGFSLQLALVLWFLGTTGIYILGFVILTHIFRHQEIKLQHANFGWYIPPVSKLLVPIAGYELAGHFTQHTEVLVTISTVSFGIGFFLFLFVGAAVYHRYIYHELPMSRFAATFFIGIAPPAIISVILFKMLHLFSHHSIIGLDATVMTTLCKFGILLTWGFAAWWFIMAIIIIIYYLKNLELPYALSWWAFTFPSGALCVSSGVAWKVSQFSIIHYFYWFSVAFLLFIWTIVFIRTMKGVLSGKIFAPTH